MTKEKIQERLKQLQAKLEEALSTSQALHGAIQDCQYWLAVLEQEDKNGSRT